MSEDHEYSVVHGKDIRTGRLRTYYECDWCCHLTPSIVGPWGIVEHLANCPDREASQ